MILPTAGSRLAAEQDQVQTVLRLVNEILDSDVVGVYLHGSAVLGGLRPSSDLDVLALRLGG